MLLVPVHAKWSLSEYLASGQENSHEVLQRENAGCETLLLSTGKSAGQKDSCSAAECFVLFSDHEIP